MLLAIFLPGLSFLLRGKIISAIFAIILQIVAVLTFLVFGLGFFIWVALAIWAVTSRNNGKVNDKMKKMERELKSNIIANDNN